MSYQLCLNQGWDEEVGQEGSGSIVEGLGPPANGLDLARGQCGVPWKPHHEAALQDDGQKSAREWNQKLQGRTSGHGHSSQGGGESGYDHQPPPRRVRNWLLGPGYRHRRHQGRVSV